MSGEFMGLIRAQQTRDADWARHLANQAAAAHQKFVQQVGEIVDILISRNVPKHPVMEYSVTHDYVQEPAGFFKKQPSRLAEPVACTARHLGRGWMLQSEYGEDRGVTVTTFALLDDGTVFEARWGREVADRYLRPPLARTDYSRYGHAKEVLKTLEELPGKIAVEAPATPLQDWGVYMHPVAAVRKLIGE